MTPHPGDFGLNQIRGGVGFLIGFGQLILKDASRYTPMRSWYWTTARWSRACRAVRASPR